MGIHDAQPEGRGHNFYSIDRALRRLLARRLGAADLERATPLLERMGDLAGNAIDRQAEYTDRHARPMLDTYDRQGQVVNHVTYNPLYEESVRQVYGLGIVGVSYGPSPLPYTVHHALLYLLSQSDPGLACPVTLTASCAFVLNRHGSQRQKERYLPGLTVRAPGAFLDGATWVTERAGGSDAGAASTQAEPVGSADGALDVLVRLTGEKWFSSNADADLALVTARPAGAEPGTRGLGLYLMPRLLDGGGMNHYRIRRLKDKLGTTGLATGEIELDGAVAELVSPPPLGFRHMLEALEFSRIANAVAASGIHRRVYLEAQLYAAQRSAFGERLDRFPMVQETIVSMLAELEASLLLSFEAVEALDAASFRGDERMLGWQRLVTALAKYRTGEDAVRNASRAIEVFGGNGYVEDYVTARMLREAQVLPVWEGPANVQALEVLRLLGGRHHTERLLLERVRSVAEVALANSAARELGALLLAEAQSLEAALGWLAQRPQEAPRHARRLMEWMADLLGVTLLLEQAAPELAVGDHRSLSLAWWLAASRLAPLPLHGISGATDWVSAAYPALTGGDAVGPIDLPALPTGVHVL